MKVFEARSVNEAWTMAVQYVLNNKNHNYHDSRAGKTLEVMKCCFSISNPLDRWVTNRYPMISPAFAIAEIFWILAGRNDAEFVNTWNPLLKKYAGDSENYHGAYGFRLRNGFEVDQLETAYEALLNNPGTRQVTLQIWDPKLDLPISLGNPNADDIPCNIAAMLKVRDGKLEWSQIMRSNDLFRGTPYNFIQFTTLQEIIAGWLNVSPGEFVLMADSLHIYTDDLEYMSSEEKKVDFQVDSLAIPKSQFDLVLSECISILEQARKNILDIKPQDLINNRVLPASYKNLLAIPLAYLALKRDAFTLVDEFEQICSNLHLLGIWMQWKEHQLKRSA